MKKLGLSIFLLLAIASAGADEIKLRPGLWEDTLIPGPGSPMARLYSSMSPQQIQVQNQLADSNEMMPRVQIINGRITVTGKTCLTDEMMNQDMEPFKKYMPKDCKSTQSRSGNTYTTHVTCSNPPVDSTVKGRMISSTEYKARQEGKDSVNGSYYNEVTSRWVSASCGDVPSLSSLVEDSSDLIEGASEFLKMLGNRK